MPSPTVLNLLDHGVHIPLPESVYVADNVVPSRISPGVTIHPGCRLQGSLLAIGPDSDVGREAPATLDDCQLGRGVQLAGGYHTGSVFLDGASMGSGAHVRPGTLIEEHASGAHTVGLKQTVIMPYVTIGSLINFCDCLMAGGTGRQDHSEVGSGYIHFNFTPHGDKATPSLIGDVARGVLLNQAGIFLGGHGGLVGPARIAYGCVAPAGAIWRGDMLLEGHLLAPIASDGATEPFAVGMYRRVGRIVRNNLIYYGNIAALSVWYRAVRHRWLKATPHGLACYVGAQAALHLIMEERTRRLAELVASMPRSLSKVERLDSDEAAEWVATQRRLLRDGPAIVEGLAQRAGALGERPENVRLAEAVANDKASQVPDYLAAVHQLADGTRAIVSRELQAIVDDFARLWPAQ